MTTRFQEIEKKIASPLLETTNKFGMLKSGVPDRAVAKGRGVGLWGIIRHPLVEIGLTDLPKYWGGGHNPPGLLGSDSPA